MNSGFQRGGGAWEASALALSYTRVRRILRGFADYLQIRELGGVMGNVMPISPRDDGRRDGRGHAQTFSNARTQSRHARRIVHAGRLCAFELAADRTRPY